MIFKFCSINKDNDMIEMWVNFEMKKRFIVDAAVLFWEFERIWRL